MLAQFQQSLRRRLPHRSIVYAFSRAAVSRHHLPPGKLVSLEQEEKADRAFILRRSEQIGPIFKAIGWGELYVCVVGLSLGRRLLRDHSAELRPMTLDVSSLFPKGFLRQMQGEDHRKYRRLLNRAIKPDDLAASTAALAASAARGLADYAAREHEHLNGADAYVATLSRITTEMMIRLFFGATPGTPAFDRLVAGYQKLGPHGLVWNVTERQREAFVDIRDFLLKCFSGPPADLPAEARQSVLGRMVEDGMPDADMMGNLIYMVETGRYDTHALFRWLTKHAGERPDFLARIRHESPGAATEKSFAEAFTLETLRTDQSERLMRRVQRNFIFDGHLIPKHATVRVCLWESHKSPEIFPHPFEFNPERFLAKPPTTEEFAPFGLDHHRCPFGDMSVRMCVEFLRALARGYTVEPTADGRPIRGAYHWEPSSNFGVRLKPHATVPHE